jgi:hypothetical protein
MAQKRWSNPPDAAPLVKRGYSLQGCLVPKHVQQYRSDLEVDWEATAAGEPFAYG